MAAQSTLDRIDRKILALLQEDGRKTIAELAERGVVPVALLEAMAAALRFDDPADAEAQELARILADSEPAAAAERITGLTAEHPLFPQVQKLIEARQAEL